ncbi:MAG: hypothetical protein AAFV51_02930 [Pseudomonadota bacterium]
MGALVERLRGVSVWAAAAVALLVLLFAGSLREPARYMVGPHAFMHHAIGQAALSSPTAPENPVAAGEPLHYPYAGDLLTAAIGSWSRLPDDVISLALNFVALLIFATLVFRAATRAGLSAPASAFSVVFGLIPFSILMLPGHAVFERAFGSNGGPIDRVVAAAFQESRAIGFIKFLNVNQNGWGLAALAACLAASLAIVDRKRPHPFAYALFGAGLLGVLLFYPIYAPVAVAVGAAVAAARWAESYYFAPVGRPFFKRALDAAGPTVRDPHVLAIAAIGVAASAVSFPYLSDVLLERPGTLSADDTAIILPLGERLFADGATLLRVCAFLVPIAFFFRDPLKAHWKENFAAAIVLTAVLGFSLALYFVVSPPLRTNYKFLLPFNLALALLTAPAAERLWRLRPLATSGLAVASILSAVVFIDSFSRNYAPSAVRAGRHYSSSDPDHRSVMEWLRSETPANSVVLDCGYAAPTFARRTLFIAYDRPGVDCRPNGRRADGWRMPHEGLVRNVLVVEAEERVVRQRLMARIFDKTSAAAPALADAAERVHGRPVFIIARTDADRERLAVAGAALRHESGEFAVLEYAPVVR